MHHYGEVNIKTILDWKSPATFYPRHSFKSVMIGSYYESGLFRAYKIIPPGESKPVDFYKSTNVRLTNLKINKKVWMVDDPIHWWAIQNYAQTYHGKVLVAGLGLGLIVHALANNSNVKSITVVEKNQDVIDTIRSLIPDCEIINSDWYEYQIEPDVDGVFFDLFVGNAKKLEAHALREMLQLKKILPNANINILGFDNFYLHQTCDSILQNEKIISG